MFVLTQPASGPRSSLGSDAVAAAARPQPRSRSRSRAATGQLAWFGNVFILGRHLCTALGLLAAIGLALLFTQAPLRQQAVRTLQQLPATPAQEAVPVADTLEEATTPAEASSPLQRLAVNPKDLPQNQSAVTYWLSRKYRVAPEAVGLLVQQAHAIGAQEKLDPLLLLSVMAIESSFNPLAQSSVGAQGLMQVMTHIHADKYQDLGGNWAAFDPVSNLQVGAKVLKGTIGQAGSVRGGLRYYVGAANLPNDRGYGDKVLAEYARIQAVAAGQTAGFDEVLPIPAVPQLAEPTKTARKARSAEEISVAANSAAPQRLAAQPGKAVVVRTSHVSQPQTPAAMRLASAQTASALEGLVRSCSFC